jgi:four helix bundle protein
LYESEKLKARSKRLAIELIRLYRTLPRTEEARLVGKQMIRAASSVAANYRAAGRARSRAEFIAKIGTVVEEIDETVFWIEMLFEADILSASATKSLHTEANELLAIFAASQRTARRS